MKNDLGLKYKKIKPVSIHANSEKNMILRLKWKQEFLKHWGDDKIFLCIDESWLNETNFIR